MREPLPDDYPVYFGYVYDIDDNRVITSEIEGYIADLRRDLVRRGIYATNIYKHTFTFK